MKRQLLFIALLSIYTQISPRGYGHGRGYGHAHFGHGYGHGFRRGGGFGFYVGSPGYYDPYWGNPYWDSDYLPLAFTSWTAAQIASGLSQRQAELRQLRSQKASDKKIKKLERQIQELKDEQKKRDSK